MPSAFGARKCLSALFEIALVFVRFDHVAGRHRKCESQHRVNGCSAIHASTSGKRFVGRVDEKLTGFVELESVMP